MRRKDDSSLSPEQFDAVRREARKALLKADAFGRFPTPVAEIMEMASVVLVPHDLQDQSFLKTLRRKAGGASALLKRALSKILGVLDVKGKLVYVEHSLLVVKQTFVKLHETGHFVLPWQRKMYALVEDCEKTLHPDVADAFDREANAFATEVLFQLDNFTNEAADHSFDIRTALKLSRKYGASIYATIRRFVRTNHRTCAVLIFNKPEMEPGVGFVATLRRTEESKSFKQVFSNIEWPTGVTPDDALGRMLPLGKRKFTGPIELILTDANGTLHECIAEAFTQSYQVFIMICPVSALSKRTILLA